MMDVFLVASKGIPARYGGFETFVERLVRGKKSQEIQYHVSCMNNDEKHFQYQGADCFNVRVPLPGPAGRILHVSRVLSQVYRWKMKHLGQDTIVYILGCRIGPLLKWHAARLHKLRITIMVNPDGLEWKRAKWSGIEKRFLRYCEKCLVVNSDLAICDSVNIESYIKKTYAGKVKKTTFLAYGADVHPLAGTDETWNRWMKDKKIGSYGYYLIVGRFVPDNNYETMILEFMKAKTDKDLVIISNVEKNKFYDDLQRKTGFEQDHRIKFVGTVYEEELLRSIREHAFAYLHGHEVGGTNPSLLEALATTKVNLLLNIGFNQEVAGKAARYWNKEEGSLSRLIENTEKLSNAKMEELGRLAKERIRDAYSWPKICADYEEIFLRYERV